MPNGGKPASSVVNNRKTVLTSRWWVLGLIAALPGMIVVGALAVVLTLSVFTLDDGEVSPGEQAIGELQPQGAPQDALQGTKDLTDFSSRPTVRWLDRYINGYTMHVLGFTLWQALLSTLISLLVGLLCALRLLCFTKRRRELLGDALLLCFVLPPLIVVFGVIALFGYNGIVNKVALELFSFRAIEGIYGLRGIVLAHVFFNAPFATYLFLQRFEELGQLPFRLASELRLSFTQVLRHVILPSLRPMIGASGALIFSLCLTSFTIVLLLGGGPRATTLPLAIFESIRVDFDPFRAAVLSCIQVALSFCALLLCAPKRITRVLPFARRESTSVAAGVYASVVELLSARLLPAWFKIFCDIFLVILLLVPIYVVVGASLQGASILGEKIFYHALFVSVALGLASSIVSCLLAVSLLWSVREGVFLQKYKRTRSCFRKFLPEFMLAIGAYPLLAVPPIVVATGLFLLLRGSAAYQSAPVACAFIALVLINSLVSLPIVLRFFAESLYALARNYSHLWMSLKIRPSTRFMAIDFPSIRSSISAVLACAFCLSLSDLSAIALFGRDEITTLPYLSYLLMGRYRWHEAGFCLATLVLMYFLLFRFFGRGLSMSDRYA